MQALRMRSGCVWAWCRRALRLVRPVLTTQPVYSTFRQPTLQCSAERPEGMQAMGE